MSEFEIYCCYVLALAGGSGLGWLLDKLSDRRRRRRSQNQEFD
jgi:hypothetical protein